MSEVITSVEEAIVQLRPMLFNYLNKHLEVKNIKKPFHCPFHDDSGRPNMAFYHKNNNETAHCFSCGATADIFKFATKLENLPSHGQEWITITIPNLCEQMGLKVNLGVQSETTRVKSQYYKLANEIADILGHSNQDYLTTRKWEDNGTIGGSIDLNDLIEKLIESGWDLKFIEETKLLGWQNKAKFVSLFDKGLYTWAIRDSYKRTVGFCFLGRSK